MYKIRSEERGLVNLSFKKRPVQKTLFEAAKAKGFRGLRDIILKARKEGVTTFFALLYLDDSLFTPNTVSEIVAHTAADVKKIFKIVKLAYYSCPNQIRLFDGRVWQKPKANYDNVNELVFDDINSAIRVSLQSRGGTVNNLHISEVAHIPENEVEARMAAILESVPNVELGSNITMETTANGMGGWFPDLWDESIEGMTLFRTFFFGWYLKPENQMTPPEDYEPSEETLDMQNRLREYDGTELTMRQLFWWEMTRSQQKKLMNQEHPTIPEDAFLSSGLHVFDLQKLNRVKTREVVRTYHGWNIYIEPKKNRRYIVAGDPAEGLGGKNDASGGVVLDAVTLEEVATFRSKTCKPKKFATRLAQIGTLYNEAMVVVERNNHGHTVLDRLKDIYSNIFMMMTIDERTHKKTKKLGWLTNKSTRDLILDHFENYYEEGAFIPSSGILKKEMMNFITNEKGKREAKSGKKDDVLMATAIALKVVTMPRTSFGIYNLS